MALFEIVRSPAEGDRNRRLGFLLVGVFALLFLMSLITIILRKP